MYVPNHTLKDENHEYPGKEISIANQAGGATGGCSDHDRWDPGHDKQEEANSFQSLFPWFLVLDTAVDFGSTENLA